VFLEVTSQEISQTDAAQKYGVDVSMIVRLRALAKDAALAAFVSAKPGRLPRRSRALPGVTMPRVWALTRLTVRVG
jgi:hypothetical protein